MIKHTPGPWIWGADFRGLYGAGPDNAVLAHAPYEGMWLSESDSIEANAKLMAAAPDLLAALTAFVEEVEGTFPFTSLDAARAAIAKATA